MSSEQNSSKTALTSERCLLANNLMNHLQLILSRCEMQLDSLAPASDAAKNCRLIMEAARQMARAITERPCSFFGSPTALVQLESCNAEDGLAADKLAAS